MRKIIIDFLKENVFNNLIELAKENVFNNLIELANFGMIFQIKKRINFQNVLRKLFVLNYAQNGMWTYFTSSILHNKDNLIC